MSNKRPQDSTCGSYKGQRNLFGGDHNIYADTCLPGTGWRQGGENSRFPREGRRKVTRADREEGTDSSPTALRVSGTPDGPRSPQGPAWRWDLSCYRRKPPRGERSRHWQAAAKPTELEPEADVVSHWWLLCAPNSQWVSSGGVAMTLAAEEAASNPQRPAWWPGPISDVQRAAPSPIGGLHDGAGGRVYKRSRRRRGRRWPRHHRHINLSFSCVWEVGAAACLFGPALRIVHCSPDPGPCHPQLSNLGALLCLRPVAGFPAKPYSCLLTDWPTALERWSCPWWLRCCCCCLARHARRRRTRRRTWARWSASTWVPPTPGKWGLGRGENGAWPPGLPRASWCWFLPFGFFRQRRGVQERPRGDHRQRSRQPHHAVLCGFHSWRGASDRRCSQEPAHLQSGEHSLRRQATHRPDVEWPVRAAGHQVLAFQGSNRFFSSK